VLATFLPRQRNSVRNNLEVGWKRNGRKPYFCQGRHAVLLENGVSRRTEFKETAAPRDDRDDPSIATTNSCARAAGRKQRRPAFPQAPRSPSELRPFGLREIERIPWLDEPGQCSKSQRVAAVWRDAALGMPPTPQLLCGVKTGEPQDGARSLSSLGVDPVKVLYPDCRRSRTRYAEPASKVALHPDEPASGGPRARFRQCWRWRPARLQRAAGSSHCSAPSTRLRR